MDKKSIIRQDIKLFKTILILIFLLIILFLNCSFFTRDGFIGDYLYVFQVNNVNHLKEIKIDRACVSRIQKTCEDSLGVKMANFACFESNSFKCAIHFWDKNKYYSRKYKKRLKKDYLVILDENCNIIKITPSIIE